MALCDYNLTIDINAHKNEYESVREYFENRDTDDIPEDVFNIMVEKDCVVEVVAYDRSTVSFVFVAHYDIDSAMDMAINKITLSHG